MNVVGVVNLRVLPLALVGRVGNALRLPLSLEVGVGDLRGLPGTVHLVIPVLGLLRSLVVNGLRNVPVLRLLVLGILNGALINPILISAGTHKIPNLGLGLRGVVDLLGQEKVEVVVQRATLDLDVVDLDLVGVVGVHDERVQVGQLI